MGYVMHLLRAEVFLARESQEEARRAVQDLARSKLGAGTPAFAWVDTSRLLAADTIHEALAAWRWMVLDEDEDGNITELDFTGEKLGDEETLFSALAPYVREGSQIQMAGEDGAIWRWLFVRQK